MAVFFSPTAVPDEKLRKYVSQYNLFISLRRAGSFLIVCGVFGIILHILLAFFTQPDGNEGTVFTGIIKKAGEFFRPGLFPLWLTLSGIGLVLIVLSALFLFRLSFAGGREFLRRKSYYALERMLTKFARQMAGAKLLVSPRFSLGREVYAFDLVAVAANGVFFLCVQPPDPPLPENLSPLVEMCRRLGGEYALPLLARPRFIQLWEPALGPEWEVASLSDLGKIFSRHEGGADNEEMTRTFRALYNLSLPEGWVKVPQDRPLPSWRSLLIAEESLPSLGNKRWGRLGRLAIVCLFLGLVAVGGIYLLQYFDYEMAERVMGPVRTLLRQVLPPEWQRSLGLGWEEWIGETEITATILPGARVGLSPRLGEIQTTDFLPSGTEWQIIQLKLYNDTEWCMIRKGEKVGWVPRLALRMRHLLKKGTTYYQRPDFSFPQGITAMDEPVALLSRRMIPGTSGEITWSKIRFLDGTIAYVPEAL